MGVVMTHGLERGYFVDAEPFAIPSRRALVVKRAVNDARKYTGKQADKIKLDSCPDRQMVEKYAAAFEAEYPGYGYRLVLLAYATGMRICELLALRFEHVLFLKDETKIIVDWQLDRTSSGPRCGRPSTATSA